MCTEIYWYEKGSVGNLVQCISTLSSVKKLAALQPNSAGQCFSNLNIEIVTFYVTVGSLYRITIIIIMSIGV